MMAAGKKAEKEVEEYKMKIKILSMDKKKEKVTFLLEDSTPGFANALRRTMIEQVPTMAIEDIEFRKNNSVLYDEIIAHRIGLIPLITDLKTYVLPEDCTCKGEGCAKCTLKLILKVKGPLIATASDIQSKDPKVVPVYPNTPIVKLLKGQDLELEATAVLGKGTVHAKWSPCLAFYKYKPEIVFNDKAKNVEKCVEICPKNIFIKKANKVAVDKDKVLDCHLCGACVDATDGEIKLNESNKDFVFTIESWGQLSAKDIVSAAVDILDAQADEFIKALK